MEAVPCLTSGDRERDEPPEGCGSGRLARDAAVDPQVLQTHRLGDYRDWQSIVEYAYRIARELDRMTFPGKP